MCCYKPRLDFDIVAELVQVGLTEEQAKAILRAKYAIHGAPAQELPALNQKVEQDLLAAGFNEPMAQTLVKVINHYR